MEKSKIEMETEFAGFREDFSKYGMVKLSRPKERERYYGKKIDQSGIQT